MIVVTHDRYFLERVSDVTYALTGGGRCDLLPGGIEQYLAERVAAASGLRQSRPDRSAGFGVGLGARSDGPARRWRASKVSSQKLDGRIGALHESMAEAASDHVRAGELNAQLQELLERKERWKRRGWRRPRSQSAACALALPTISAGLSPRRRRRFCGSSTVDVSNSSSPVCPAPRFALTAAVATSLG